MWVSSIGTWATTARLLLPVAVAMGAIVIWRVSTFYPPAIEGFFAAKYLQEHGYL